MRIRPKLPNAPVYLTKNGHGQFSVHSIEDDAEFERARAMFRLLTELNRGIQSGEEQGWLSGEEQGWLSGEEQGWLSGVDLDRHFTERRKSMTCTLREIIG